MKKYLQRIGKQIVLGILISDLIWVPVVIAGKTLDDIAREQQAFQQDVATLIHLDFSALSDHFLELFCLWIPHRIRESVETQPVNENIVVRCIN